MPQRYITVFSSTNTNTTKLLFSNTTSIKSRQRDDFSDGGGGNGELYEACRREWRDLEARPHHTGEAPTESKPTKFTKIEKKPAGPNQPLSILSDQAVKFLERPFGFEKRTMWPLNQGKLKLKTLPPLKQGCVYSLFNHNCLLELV